jgi:transposase
MTIRGVGPITSLAFRVAVDDPTRFDSSKAVGAHLGLTPRVYQSGEIDRSGQISKAGDHLLRHLPYEAASAPMTRCRQLSKLRAWGVAITRRRGAKRAQAVVARKLALIMLRMWGSGSRFETGVDVRKPAVV